MVLRRPLESTLAATIGMVQQPRNGTAIGDGHVQGGQGQLLRHGLAHPLRGYSNRYAAGTLSSFAQPTTLRENRSSTTARYSHPSPVAM